MSPETLAFALGMGAAVTLALANVFVKSGGDILVSRASTSLSGAVLMIPVACLVPLPSPTVWGMLALSIPCHMAYQACLVRAMHRGDLSLVFPVMRGSAPLLTAVTAFAVLGERLHPLSLVGLVLASLAIIVFALPERHIGGDARQRRIALGWALATGVGIAFYNVVDARGVRAAEDPLTFISWLFILDAPAINIAAILYRKRAYPGLMLQKLRYGAAAGAMSILSFGMTLYAFRMAPVSLISALRETAVVWVAILGVLMLKEGFGARRIAAAAALAGGLILYRAAS